MRKVLQSCGSALWLWQRQCRARVWAVQAQQVPCSCLVGCRQWYVTLPMLSKLSNQLILILRNNVQGEVLLYRARAVQESCSTILGCLGLKAQQWPFAEHKGV
jgi:hypothetical protein